MGTGRGVREWDGERQGSEGMRWREEGSGEEDKEKKDLVQEEEENCKHAIDKE